MRLDLLQEPLIDAMGNYLNRLTKRQQIVASNLANIDTPGYKTKDISFYATMEELLSESSVPLRASRPEHNAMTNMALAPLEPEVFEVRGLPRRADHNNVDIDREMLKLGETSFGYSLITQMLRGKFRTLTSVINDGRMG
jgi:flagellar basal-body rod protein FlgB